MADETPTPRSWLWRTANTSLVVLFIVASWVVLGTGLIGLSIGAFYTAERVRAMVAGDLGWWPAMYAGVITFFIVIACGVAAALKTASFLAADEPVPVVKNGKTVRERVPEHELQKVRPSAAEIERRGMGRG